MRKLIAVIGGCCIIAALMVAVSMAAGVEEKEPVVEQRIARLEEQNARLEEQLRQLMGSQDRPETTDQRLQTADHGFGSKDKTGWSEGGVEPAGTATASDVLTGKTFYSGGSWAQDTGTATLGALPSGVIVMWSGRTVPAGWALCNGDTIVVGTDTTITPDLRDRFIYGSDTTAVLGTTGGASTYTLTVDQLPSHTHTGITNTAGAHSHTYWSLGQGREFRPGTGWSAWTGLDSKNTSTAGDHRHTFTTDPTGGGMPFDNRPAFMKLAFIMKL